MKRLLKSPWIVCLALLSAVMFAACATAPAPVPGFAPGKYTNAELRFTVEFPEKYKLQPTQGETEVFRAANPNAWKVPVLYVTVADATDTTLDAAAWLKAAEATQPGSKRYKMLSEKAITLNDGTPALALTYKWTWTDGNTKLQSATVTTVKNGKSISAGATTVLGGDTTPEMLLEMCSSLKFF